MLPKSAFRDKSACSQSRENAAQHCRPSQPLSTPKNSDVAHYIIFKLHDCCRNVSHHQSRRRATLALIGIIQIRCTAIEVCCYFGRRVLLECLCRQVAAPKKLAPCPPLAWPRLETFVSARDLAHCLAVFPEPPGQMLS